MAGFIRKALLLSLVLVFVQGCTLDAVRLNQQARVYMEYGHYDKARDLLIKSFDADYENPASHFWLARCYEALGDTTKAAWEYELAVRMDPSMELAQMGYIIMLNKSGQEDKSIEAANIYLKNKSGASREFIHLAETFIENGMLDHALMAYHRAGEVEPTNPEPLIVTADFCYSREMKDLGDDYLTQAFKRDPYYPGLAYKLGEHGLRISVPQPKLITPPSEMERRLSDY